MNHPKPPIDVEWEPINRPGNGLFMTKEVRTVEAHLMGGKGNSCPLAIMQVTTRPMKPDYRPGSRWKYHWHVEFHTARGWSSRFTAMGVARTVEMGKRAALLAAMAFMATITKKFWAHMSVAMMGAENSILKRERRERSSVARLVRYVVKRDLPDSETKESLLRYTRIARMG